MNFARLHTSCSPLPTIPYLRTHMDTIHELTLNSPDGLIDVRLEPTTHGTPYQWTATILYPNIVNGFSRSEIYCHDLSWHPESRAYTFDASDEIHPKILRLETQISDYMVTTLKNTKK